ncbi:17983_t:CDS:2 [Gigaspora margarita]|uniref:17983_t:CDS:1 n=1 Tax=Gigaspora margarita TaxID=4874 RepID=A0ABN7US60_GIGMA|nr:17983_t:CDS:2 [Gigaspora margarita]
MILSFEKILLVEEFSDLNNLKLNQLEWKFLENIALLLKKFAKLSTKMCSSSYPTISAVYSMYNYLMDHYEKRMDTRIFDNISKAAKAAWNKLCDYYNKTSESYHYASTILDPYWKLNNNLTIQNENDDDEDFLFPVPKHFHNHNSHDELNAYFESSAEPDKINVLEWWRTHEQQYPTLAIMARDYLLIPATSAPVERLFSESGNVITYERNRLEGDTIQAIMCLKSWL